MTATTAAADGGAYDYDSDYAKKRTLQVLNNGESRIRELQRNLRDMDKLLKNTRLDFVYCRTVMFGRGKGRTGKEKNTNKRQAQKRAVTLDAFRIKKDNSRRKTN
jgi:hypothetical protein